MYTRTVVSLLPRWIGVTRWASPLLSKHLPIMASSGLTRAPTFDMTAVPGTLSDLPPLIAGTQVRTFKDKDVLKLRCSACYFKKVDDRWWVLCSKHPRHKQRQKMLRPEMNWIVTHITRTGSYRKKHFQHINHDL